MKKKPQKKHAWSVKVGEKGQFVIPKEARDIFGISPGDTLILLGDEKKGLAIPPKSVIDKLNAMILGSFGYNEDEEEDEE